MFIPSVVVHDLNVCRPDFSPYETDAPLVVDPDAVLTSSIALQGFQAIARRSLQEVQCLCRVQLSELSLSDPCYGFEATWTSAFIERLRVFASERLDHGRIVLRGA
jgi:hypothetical protein